MVRPIFMPHHFALGRLDHCAVSTPGGALGERSDAEVEDITANEFHKMTTIEKMKTLRCLVAKDPLPEFAFQQITLKARWLPGVPYALQFVTDYVCSATSKSSTKSCSTGRSAGAIRKML
ncbi:hypothetical protein QR680_017214 [Steinernema hermaphroditum]|uniref:Uncharacterized protein n=1 Tax=Steinernema hermaphroditum TaxID=289476 RepID=A0AA39HDR5_9BILA|nr:hypothetical protein QR680_017214 [Steinernema hermaphroditum]